MSDMGYATDHFELLIFDWDGTLADSLQHIVGSMHYAISKLGFPEKADDDIRDIIGLGLEEALQRLFPGIRTKQRQEMALYYRQYYISKSAQNVRLFPEVEQTIKLLHGNGHRLAVATGKSRQGLDRALHDCGLASYFQYSRCADETFSKPHPQMLEDIIELSACARNRVLMIGDSEHDLQMARNAGVAAAAVSYGAQDSEYLLKFGPVACFNSLDELPPWLTGVTGGLKKY